MDNLKLCKWLSDEFGITDQQYDAYIHSFNKDVMSGSPVQDNCWKQRAEAAEAALEVEKDIHDDTMQAMHLWCERAKEAEAQLAELKKQQAVGVARMELAIGKEGLRYYQCFVDMRPDLVVAELNTGMELFTRPAPAADLAELVPPEADISNLPFAAAAGWNACRAAILRNIEEAKK
ncbi:hypothetical protein MED16_gp44 [Pantoea phage vB_PagS_MED16]|nr:hypothetical protein MED16_gp44 [Pantoea phage vB_PagS_MED16]